MAQAVEWGQVRRAAQRHRPGVIVTPLVLDEFNGPHGKEMA